MDIKQEELEAFVQQENYDIVAIMEVWQNDLHNWDAAVDCHKHFTKDSQGRKNVGVALDIGECFDCLELNDGDSRVSVYFRVREKDNKALVGVC